MLFQPSTSTFYIEPPNAPLSAFSVQFGQGSLYGGTPIPISGDFTGDGRTDIALYQPSTSTFFVIPSNNPNQPYSVQFGTGTNNGGRPEPVVGDFNGSGRDQLAVFDPTTSNLFIQGQGADQFGQGSLYGGKPIPLVGDFNGSGRDQVAVFQPSTSTFYVQGVGGFQFGQGSLYGGNPIPVVNDYVGNGVTDMAVYQPASGTFFIRGVGAFPFGNAQTQVQHGDIPIAALFAATQGLVTTASVIAAPQLSTPAPNTGSSTNTGTGNAVAQSLDLGGSAARLSSIGASAAPSQILSNSSGTSATSTAAGQRPAQAQSASITVDSGRSTVLTAVVAPSDDLLVAALDELGGISAR